MAGRRTSLASLAGAKVETVPGQSDPTLVRLPLAKVVPTPLNPRTDFGGADALTELGESMRRRQLQPVVVVGRTSYLRLFPEHGEQVGDASYVIITGERRYRGARQVDLPTIGAIILEEIATSRADVLDAVLSENIDRKNFNPIEEALAVQAMVKECGTAVSAAGKFGRTEGWVSQRLSLLRLAPEVQVLVRSGEVPVREARALARHDPAQQMSAWRDRIRERARAKENAQRQPEGERAAAAAGDMVPVLGVGSGLGGGGGRGSTAAVAVPSQAAPNGSPDAGSGPDVVADRMASPGADARAAPPAPAAGRRGDDAAPGAVGEPGGGVSVAAAGSAEAVAAHLIATLDVATRERVAQLLLESVQQPA